MKLKFVLIVLIIFLIESCVDFRKVKHSILLNTENSKSKKKNVTKWMTPTKTICINNNGTINSNGCRAKWQDAQSICIASGGRLPRINELKQVVIDCGGEIEEDNAEERLRNVNNSSYQSCYNSQGFSFSYYWSSTSFIKHKNNVWSVNFFNGMKDGYHENNPWYIRCLINE